ncbi:MAG: diguanylate cyclase, partial [Cyanobacteria bacterium J06632_3]
MDSRFTGRSGLILIVDDTPTNLSLLAQVLGDAGFEVAIATSGERALDQVQRERPDLILLDMMMPGIGGLETCRRLKADSVLNTIPVIFITALTGVEHKVKALGTGGVDYITKPFQEKEVVYRVAIHLELHKTKMQLAQSERRIENVLNSLQEVVWSAYLDPFEIIYLNPSVEAIYGLSPKALMEQPQQWIDRIAEEDAHLLRSHLSNVLNKKLLDTSFDGESFDIEYRVIGLHGRAHWLQCRAKIQLEPSTQRFRVDGILSDNTARKLAEQKLVDAAQKDSLTSLANRAFFIDKLNHLLAELHQCSPAIQASSKLALLFIDLDRFKNVNDSVGHSVGDQLLIQVSQRLRKAVRPADLLARLGGDEFTILIENIRTEKDVQTICDRIQSALSQPLEIDGYAFTVTASIGVAMGSELYSSATDMLRAADIAMYEAKRQGRACYQLFSQQMYEQVTHKLSLENELRHALSRQEIFLEYQPILTLKTEELSGFEALMRWRHADLGLISPGEFIPLAEEIGLINELGE